MYADTESALHILQQMPKPSSKQSLQHATYALLLAEAQYKSDISQNDSLINIACDYFLPRENHQRKALSLYLKGCILNEQHREDEALPLLLQAEEEVQLTDDYRLGHLNAAEIGILYSYRDLLDYAETYFNKALKYANLSNDSNYIASSFQYLGRVEGVKADMLTSKRSERDYSKAIALYNKALEYAPERSYAKASAYSELANYYRNGMSSNLEKALLYEKKGIEYKGLNGNLDQNFLGIGIIYRQMGKNDSARYYLDLAKESSNLYTARGAYRNLRRISIYESDYKSANKYASVIIDLQDSINTISRERSLIEMQEKYDQQRVINEKNQIKMQRDRLLRYSLIIIIILFIVISIIYLKNRRNNDTIRKYAFRLIENENLLEKNKIQIDVLQEQIKKGEANESLMLSIEALQKDEEILREENAALHLIMNNYKNTISNKNTEINRLYLIIEENESRNNYIASLQYKLKEQTPILRKLKRKPAYIEDKQWKEIKELAQLLFSGFEKLQDNNLNLSEADIELICLIKFDFTDEEIATMLAISTPSVYKRKQRLKEHLQRSNINIISIEDWIRGI